METARVGLLKTTFVDYPGEVAATVFTHGCNLRCPYCHNPELVTGPIPGDLLPMDEVLAFLKKRRNVLTGVCITGGEPLLQPWLPEFSAAIHELGLKVKLDSNGLLPDRIDPVRADYIAMDIKCAPERYAAVSPEGATDTAATSQRVRSSIAVIRASGSEYEYRTTVLEPLVSEDDIRSIVAILEPGERYTLAAFRPGKTLDPAFSEAPAPSSELLERYAGIARERGLQVHVRNHRI